MYPKLTRQYFISYYCVIWIVEFLQKIKKISLIIFTICDDLKSIILSIISLSAIIIKNQSPLKNAEVRKLNVEFQNYFHFQRYKSPPPLKQNWLALCFKLAPDIDDVPTILIMSSFKIKIIKQKQNFIFRGLTMFVFSNQFTVPVGITPLKYSKYSITSDFPTPLRNYWMWT